MNSRFLSLLAVVLLVSGVAVGRVLLRKQEQAKPNQAKEEQPEHGTPKHKQEAPRGQESPVQLKTQLVEIRAVVTNKQGRLIDELKREDFEVLEDARPQAISFFSAESVASPAAKPGAPPGPDISARSATPAATSGRNIVIVVDSLNMSASSLLRTKQTLRKFVDEKLGGSDRVALVATSGSLGLLGAFTQDRPALEYAIDRLSSWGGGTRNLFSPYLASMVDRGDADAMSLAIALLQAEDHITGDRQMLVSLAQQRARQVLADSNYQRRTTLLTLKEVIRRLAELPGLRIITFISDGFSLRDTLGGTDTGDLVAVTSTAVRSGVMIYCVHAKGLVASPLFDASLPLPGLRQAGVLNNVVSASENDLRDGLNALSNDTGGEAFFDTNDMLASLQQALHANTVYYALAYYPPDVKNKHVRRITVKVRNHPEYLVRSQKGYVAEEPIMEAKADKPQSPQERLMKAVLGVLPVTDIKVEASADYLEMDGRDVQVYLHTFIEGTVLNYQEQSQRYRFKVEVFTAAYDLTGKAIDPKVDTVEGNLKPEAYEMGKRSGFLYNRALNLKPGLYQIRVGVRDEAADKTGTATAWVEVPDLSRRRMVLSSLMVADGTSIDSSPGLSKSAMQDSPPARSRIIRFFRNGDTLAYYLRVYNTPADAEEGSILQMSIALLQAAQMVAETKWEPVSSRQVGKDSKGIDVGGQLQLTDLRPGIYDLRVTITNPKTKRTVDRTAPFGVEAR